MLAGHIQESSKKLVLKAVTNQEALIDDCLEEGGKR